MFWTFRLSFDADILVLFGFGNCFGYFKSRAIFQSSGHPAPSFACKDQTSPAETNILAYVGARINYGRKKFYNTGPWTTAEDYF
jgi:hypothetical protein